MQVLFLIAQSDSGHMNLPQICEQTGIHKSTVFGLLQTLHKHGIVQTEGKGKGYTLGPGLIRLSTSFLDSLNIPRLAEPILSQLVDEIGVTTALGLIADNDFFVAAKHEGRSPAAVSIRLGQRFPLTYGCHGKAICACLSKAELDTLLGEENAYFHGDSPNFSRQKLIKEIAEYQQNGFAEDLEETTPGLNAIAAAVIDANQRPVGDIVALGLESADVARQCGPIVATAARRLSRKLGAVV